MVRTFEIETETLQYRQSALVEMMMMAHMANDCTPAPDVVVEYLSILREINEEINRRVNLKAAV